MAERGGIYGLLESSRAYTIIQSGIGRPGTHERVRVRHFPELERDGVRVLDIGCGPGPFLSDYVAESRIEYVGFDPNHEYIETARQQFPDSEFHVGTTETLERQISGEFDLAVAMGVLHHVNDRAGRDIVRFAHSRLVGGGRFVSVDPVFIERQHPVAWALARLDRGKHVRRLEAYRALVETCFPSDSVTSAVESDWLRVPYNHAVVTGTR